jgi:hypothetical protein
VFENIKAELLKNSRLSTQGFWLYSPISILAFPVSVLVAGSNVNPLIAFGGGFILTAVTYAAYLIQLEALKRFKPVISLKLFFFFTVIIVTGALRGVFFYFLVDLLGLTQPSDLSNRVISSTFTTVFWLALSNYVISVSRNFRYQYQAALHHYLLGGSNQDKSGKLSDENQKVLDNLQKLLSSSLQNYLGKDDPASFRSLSTVLTQQINDQIRPLSRRIFIRNLSDFPFVEHKQLLKDALQTLDFSWRWLFLIITSLAITSNIAIRTLPETFWRCIAFLIPLYLLMLLHQKIKNKFLNRSLDLNLIFLVSVGIIPVFVSEFFALLLNFNGNWLATLTISPVAPVVMYVLALLRLTQQDRKMIIETLQNSISRNNLTLPGDLDIESASIASYLHNTLQSELSALSRQLEVAANEQNPIRSAELLQRVSSRVNRSIADDYKQFAESPLERLDVVIDSWKGILEITVDLPLEALAENRKNSTLVQTIEEVATNVSRYDVATKLHVSAVIKNEGILITFQSNGSGKLVKSRGSGTTWLNRIALSEWSIEKNEIGTLLTIEI